MPLLQLLHLPQAALSAWGLYLSAIAIVNLRKYEQTTKKAAEYSKTVEQELHKTQSTQTSGAIAVFLSLEAALILSSVGYLLQPPAWLRYVGSPFVLFAVSVARAHVAGYWAPQDGKNVGVRVPLPKMEAYNEAQKKTEDMLQVLQWLQWSWGVTSVAAGVVGY
ncbi:hypothetical protein MBLNU230_g6466t1 [Neophaeotheca triangularis]